MTPNKPTVKTSPIMEVVAKKLFGISTVPKEEQERMVNRACKAAQAYHTAVLKELREEVDMYWKFDSNQQPLSSWHEKQKLLELINKRIDDKGSEG